MRDPDFEARVQRSLFYELVRIAETFKDHMDVQKVSVPALAKKSGISASRIRRILRAQNSRLDMETTVTLAFHLGLKTESEFSDVFRAAIRRGMEANYQEREAESGLSEFKERYKI